MSLDDATVHSVNVIFAQLDLDVGPENVTETAQEMGIEAPLESVPAEGIGGLSYGVTPLEMATPTRPSPTAASITNRPPSAGSSSPTARSTNPIPRTASGSSPRARPTKSPGSSRA